MGRLLNTSSVLPVFLNVTVVTAPFSLSSLVQTMRESGITSAAKNAMDPDSLWPNSMR